MNSRDQTNKPAIVSTPRHILASLAPQLMSKRILSNSFPASFSSSHLNPSSSRASALDLSRTLKLLLPDSLGGRGGISFNDVLITDPTQIDQLLALDLPSPSSDSDSPDLSLLDGFQASLCSPNDSKNQRRRRRAEIGFKLLGFEHSDRAWLNSNSETSSSHRRKSSIGPADRQSTKKKPARRRKTDVIGLSKAQSSSQPALDPLTIKEILPELQSELAEIIRDQENLQIRKEFISRDLNQIDLKILELTKLKNDLEQSMLTLKEDELELIDEYEGVSDQLLELQEKLPLAHDKLSQPTARPPKISSTNSRRRRGPAFLPSEHDELPKNVSFMTLRGHSQAIVALDFSSPYGYLVSSSLDESVQIWDLATGESIQNLKGHNGTVKCLQVEDMTCITGGLDGQICIWDLDRAIEFDSKLESSAPQDEQTIINGTAGIHLSENHPHEQTSSNQNACVMKLEGHSRSVTALYFDDTCLVTGSSDKTIRQWDLNTGQAVMTMDILWAMQNVTIPPISSSSGRQLRKPSIAISDFEFGPKFNDPLSKNWRKTLLKAPFNHFDSISAGHEDYIGGIQFWGYALASGSGDGCVRMWDMRTGQAHRTLIGHTGPITCLQFDEIHLVSGSTDKSIKIWDLRTGAITETIKYNHSITALQFDSRKIISAAGDTNINVYNRTTLQRTTINMNGHSDAVERLRYFDRYMVTGSKDATIKVWSI